MTRWPCWSGGCACSLVHQQWGVYVRFLDRGDEIGIDADRMIDTMSLIKVPILVALMRRVDRGDVDLDRRITLEDNHKRLGTGVLRLFDAGASFTVHDAARMMIVVSDNTATDICLEAPERVAGTLSLTPMGRMGTPDEVADGVVFLASDELTFVTGVALPIDGGFTAQ